MIRSFLYVLVLLSLLFSSCKKEELEGVKMTIDPADFSIDAQSGDILTFSINISSDVALKNLKIEEKVKDQYISVLKDTVLDSKKFSWRFEYKAREFESEYEVLYLYFSATDSNGDQFQISKIVTVYTYFEEETEETTGHVLYSSASEKFNAFNLDSLTPSLSSHLDTLSMHIVDGTDSASTMLSKTWISPAGLQFVRFNDLDYGNALKSEIKIAYESGLKHDVLQNIGIGDVLLTRLNVDDENVYYAIKIHDVIDAEGIELDRYVFNVKK